MADRDTLRLRLRSIPAHVLAEELGEERLHEAWRIAREASNAEERAQRLERRRLRRAFFEQHKAIWAQAVTLNASLLHLWRPRKLNSARVDSRCGVSRFVGRNAAAAIKDLGRGPLCPTCKRSAEIQGIPLPEEGLFPPRCEDRS